jgi:uracil-DNA glycosylase
MCPFEKVRVVIVGQDPYHGVGQANGLAFSVSRGASLPPSLRNIYKELYDDCGIPPATHGDLSAWAEQGVLLLNATLTVRAHTAGSHQGKGWETYTDALLDSLAQKRDGIVFLLWGAYAQKKTALLDFSRHMVLTAPHPSPFSAHTGFFGCRHFGKTNRFLRARGLPPIEWQLPS